MTWITPLDAVTSACVTTASLTFTSTPTPKDNLSPFSASVVSPSERSVDITKPVTTWYVRMSTSVAFSSSVSKVLKSIPAAVKASSVGANTVKGPSPCNVLTKSACTKAATNESWTPVFCALVGMSSFSSATTAGVTRRLAVTSKAITETLRFIATPHDLEY